MADKPRRDKVKLAEMLISRWNSMQGEVGPWKATWQDIADYVMPRKAEIYSQTDNPNTARNDVLFDTTAIFANSTLANGMLSYMTPAGSRWFSFDPPEFKKGEDKAKLWFQQCTDIAVMALASSNFYSEIHENYFDDGGFGTSNLICLPGRNNLLNFQNMDIGSYCIAEDDEGLVDTTFRELRMTCRQAAQKFGEENLSPKMKETLAKFRKEGKGDSEKKCILHCIYPRDDMDREPGKMDGPNKPYASVYVDYESKHTISEGGFEEKPFFASRHLKWRDSAYGYSPSWMALPEARQLNFLTKQLDALAEITAFPRMLFPEDHDGTVDMRAGGVTYFDPNNQNGIPREWATSGNYNVGLDREERKQKAIERAYHVDLFQMFAQLDKQMTAREVAERSAEKLVQFTPAFARKDTELLRPLLKRVFGILLRQGMFPPPPNEVLIVRQDGSPGIPDPEVSYSSRVALAIKALHNTSFFRTMEIITPIVPMRPDILDNFDFDQIARDGALNDGLPANWMLPVEERDEMRAARAEAQAKAQQMQEALVASEAAKNAGSVKPDSVVGQALSQQ